MSNELSNDSTETTAVSSLELSSRSSRTRLSRWLEPLKLVGGVATTSISQYLAHHTIAPKWSRAVDLWIEGERWGPAAGLSAIYLAVVFPPAALLLASVAGKVLPLLPWSKKA